MYQEANEMTEAELLKENEQLKKQVKHLIEKLDIYRAKEKENPHLTHMSIEVERYNYFLRIEKEYKKIPRMKRDAFEEMYNEAVEIPANLILKRA